MTATKRMTQEQIEDLCLSSNPFDGDDTDVTLLADKFVNVRKRHTCIICQGRIKIGERVRSRTERNNEEQKVMTFYFCPICCRADAKAEDDDCDAISARYEIGKRRSEKKLKARLLREGSKVTTSEVPS